MLAKPLLISAILLTTAAVPIAGAQLPQGQPTCVPLPGGTGGAANSVCIPFGGDCMGNANWTCIAGKCPAAATGGTAGTKGGSENNCAEYACQVLGQADPLAPPALAQPTCHDTLCRDIPALYGTAYSTITTEGFLLLPPQVISVAYPLLLRLAVVCNPGSGGGYGTGCNEILYTPVARAGFDANVFVNPTSGTVNVVQCAWATTSLAGYTFLGERDNAIARTVGTCGNTLYIVPVFGSSGAAYTFTNGCPPLP
ncbi:MAG: hypothetical protein ACYDCK_12570 [Thermoplasmatota archaeon]